MTSYDRMVNRLLAQFNDKPVIYALLNALGTELDRLDEVRKQINEQIYPSTAIGKQLDICGEIAAIDRTQALKQAVNFFGFPHHGDNTFGTFRFRRYGETYEVSSDLLDNEYKTILLGKIAKNNTDGSRESTIDCIKKVFSTDEVLALNEGNAKAKVYIGTNTFDELSQFIIDNNLVVIDEGIGVQLLFFKKDGTFGFTIDGVPQDNVTGFTINGIIITG